MNRILRLPVVAVLLGLGLLSACGGGGGSTPAPTVTAPSITTQPAAMTVNQGQPASFTVAASGTAPLSYQWRKDGTAIAGATAATYSLAAAQPSDAGSYTVVVSNSGGSVTSTPAVLTVNPLPVIQSFTATPALIPVGASGILAWTVTGATTLSVDQGVGSLDPSTGTRNVAPLSTTTYTLTATNAAGAATATATLTVDATPFQITSFAASPTVVAFGGSSTLSWTYTGLPLNLTLDGAFVAGLSAAVAPVRRQAYTLAGMNGAGADSRTLQVAAQGLDVLAGDPVGAGFLDGTGNAAQFNFPYGIVIDGAGNAYVADTWNHAIRKVSPAGVVTTLAGGTGGFADGSGSAAQFRYPSSIAVDGVGNLYVADAYNHAIRKVSPAGVVATLAGGTYGFADGTGSAAQFNLPSGVTADGVGNVYVADTWNHAIRKVSPAGVVTTLAGGTVGFADGTGSAAQFNLPSGVTVDGVGNVYVADSDNHAIRKVSPAGVVTTLAGGTGGFADGTGSAARFYYPNGVAVDGEGNVFVADTYACAIRKVSPAGVVTTLAGGTMGFADGTGSAARFYYPNGVAVDGAGNVHVADSWNQAIRKVNPTGGVTTLAGDPSRRGFLDGTGSAAQFTEPSGVAVDGTGNVYVADTYNHAIRKVSPAGVVTTLAGRFWGFADGTGNSAQFRSPQGVAADGAGNVYVADSDNHAIRKVSPAGVVTTLAGGTGGFADGMGSAAQFYYPHGVAVDGAGNVYVADSDNHAIRKVSPAGVVTTLAGGTWGFADGTGSAAQFYAPCRVTVDGAGNVYVADTSNCAIRKVSPAGVVTTLAGGTWGFADGTGSAAQFYLPCGVTVDGVGNVYVADTWNHAIRKVSPTGVVTTVAGIPGLAGVRLGPLPGSLLQPRGVAITPEGDLIVTCNNGLVQITAPETSVSAPTITTQPVAQMVVVGRSASFSVVASGMVPLSYQWHKDGASVPGATASTYSLASAQLSDAGNYSVVVSNAIGSATSDVAVLTVSASAVAPTIMSHPASLTVTVGQPVSFSVTASGTAPLTYQWKKDGAAISGATSATFSLAAAQATDAGSYTVVVSNGAGGATSSVATLTVNAVAVAPSITTQPTSQTVTAGQPASFTVVASGTVPLSYQWRKDGTAISSATAATFSLAAAQASDTGNYTVVVSNSVGSTTSKAATLTVITTGAPLDFVLPGGATLEVKPIPGGTFPMGAYENEQDAFSEELPQHSVTLSPFYMATTETTQAQWLALMGSNPSYHTGDLTRPVEMVSYLDITDLTTGFLKMLNDATAATRPVGLEFRLPTEAEWEYAARGGQPTRFYWGDDLTETLGNAYAWWGNPNGPTMPVGGKLPNAYGLYDMSGNVWEWCQDWYESYSSEPVVDPAGPQTGGSRVIRGGAFHSPGPYCRSAFRARIDPSFISLNNGFRVVLASPRTP